ncbi:MAG TPA: hypothetical protein VMV86_01260, partial [Methanosarcinales archaeon]|nr:hypothetical protein [Methanosarcinales archaeon]
MAQKYSKAIRNDETAEISDEFTKHSTTHVIVSKAGVFVGEAECGEHDEFYEERGAYIAQGRAEKAMAVALGAIDTPK